MAEEKTLDEILLEDSRPTQHTEKPESATSGTKEETKAGQSNSNESRNTNEKETTTTQNTETKQPEFDYGVLNEIFGSEFKSKDDLVKFKDNYTKLSDRAKELEGLASEFPKLKELVESHDPMQYFASEKEYIRNQLLKKYPDYNPDILGKLSGSDLTKVSDRDLILMDLRLKNPEINNESFFEQKLNKTFGYDPDDPDSAESEYALMDMKIEAKKIRKEFEGLSEGIKIPEKVNIKNEVDNSVKEKAVAWHSYLGNYAKKHLSEYSFGAKDYENVSSVKVDEKAMANYVERATIMAVNSNIDINSEDGKNAVSNTIRDQILLDNREKIFLDFYNRGANETDKIWRERAENPTKPEKNHDQNPKVQTYADRNKAERQRLGLSD